MLSDSCCLQSPVWISWRSGRSNVWWCFWMNKYFASILKHLLHRTSGQQASQKFHCRAHWLVAKILCLQFTFKRSNISATADDKSELDFLFWFLHLPLSQKLRYDAFDVLVTYFQKLSFQLVFLFLTILTVYTTFSGGTDLQLYNWKTISQLKIRRQVRCLLEILSFTLPGFSSSSIIHTSQPYFITNN